jgi:hypothetical protein
MKSKGSQNKKRENFKMSCDSSDVREQATHHVMALPFSLISVKLILPLLDLELNLLSPTKG